MNKHFDTLPDYRVIFYHKQHTSARTRFVCFEDQHVCAFEALPASSTLKPASAFRMLRHPASVLSVVAKGLDLPVEALHSEGGFEYSVNTPAGDIQIILVGIDTLDPPFKQVEKISARFIDLTQAREMTTVELELLRHAYELILGD